MHIDCSMLPNPLLPDEDDVYMTPDRRRTLVVTRVPPHAIEDRDPSAVISYVLDGSHLACPQGQLLAILASIQARPWGRLDRSQAARPQLSRDPEVVAKRLAAFGPHLRKLREQYGLSMGDLARALGCPPARLSMLELGEPDPVREGAGVREDEGRAALAELLTEAVSRPRGALASARDEVWADIHGMLSTAPALAAMSTIMRAQEDADQPTSSGAFRVGDRVFYKNMEATIEELDGELQAARLRLGGAVGGGENCIALLTDLALANENVAIDTARAGLAHLIATEIGANGEVKGDAGRFAAATVRDAWRPAIEALLASDEAQRLIRLHG